MDSWITDSEDSCDWGDSSEESALDSETDGPDLAPSKEYGCYSVLCLKRVRKHNVIQEKKT